MIFIDRSVPKPVASALQAVRKVVIWFDEQFEPWTKDPEWLLEVGNLGWIVISRDKKIRTRPGERQAVRDAGVGCFYLRQKQTLTKWDFLKLIVATLDEMEHLFEVTERPFIYGIGRTGDFRLI